MLSFTMLREPSDFHQLEPSKVRSMTEWKNVPWLWQPSYPRRHAWQPTHAEQSALPSANVCSQPVLRFQAAT